MQNCKTQGCRTILTKAALNARGPYCRSCIKRQPVSALEATNPPSSRSKVEWEVLRDKYANCIAHLLAKGESIEKYQALYEQAVQAVSAAPVEVCPHELSRLRLIEQEARELADTLLNAGVPPKGGSSHERTMPYLTRMFRGRNFRGCFRGQC